MKDFNQLIKCDVSNCEFNNVKDYSCSLNSIDVSCNGDKSSCHNKKETICNSFREKRK